MPRLRNVQNGAVVSCSDETAGRLGSEWEPVKPPVKPSEKPSSKSKK